MQDVHCYTWDETEGKRGSVEISSCIYKYIMAHPDITHVRMMSNSCGGQQKNSNFCAMCLHAVNDHPCLELIDHVFFVPGHSEMECDSAHSKIEKKSKPTAVYTPECWAQVMRMVRTNPSPFNVTKLMHDDFINFNPGQ